MGIAEVNKSDPIFERIRKARGGVAGIHTSFSDFPAGVSAHFDFYSSLVLDEDLPLPRDEREWLAVATSEHNKCPYCVHHHAAAYEEKKTEKNETKELRLSALSQLAKTLTAEPWRTSILHEQFVETGFSEAQWQHAVMVVSYFNFANRCAHAMDLELESDFMTTCK